MKTQETLQLFHKRYIRALFKMVGGLAVLATIVGLIILSAGKANAQPLDFYNHPYRPSVAGKQPPIMVSLPLLPITGSENFLAFRNLKTITSSFKVPDMDGDQLEKVMETMKFINRFHGLSSDTKLDVYPMLMFGLNTKYFEFRMAGGVISSNSASFSGLDERLGPDNVQLDADNNPYVDLEKAKDLMVLRSINILGGEFMAIGKIPIKRFVILFGTGPVIGYKYNHTYRVFTAERLTADEGLDTAHEKERGLVWGMNAMVGVEHNDGIFNPRFVVEGRKLYSSDMKEYRPEVNIGLGTDLWKVGHFAMDVMNMENPMVRLEYSKSFKGHGKWKFNDVAVGGVFQRPEGEKHLGYVSLGLGGEFANVQLMCLFSKNVVGGMLSVSLGFWRLKPW